VIADKSANPVFVASDLLSQAEHGTDSQVVLVAIDLSPSLLAEIEDQIDVQAKALPRVAIAKEAIKKSLIVQVSTLEEGVDFSNEYAPEHLILHLEDSAGCVAKIDNAGSVFVGQFSPERYVPLSFPQPYPSNNQLRRLRFRNQSHPPNKRLRPSILWSEHFVIPKTHYLPRTHCRWIKEARSHGRYISREGRVGSSCECC
jgi:hypothetical protein